MEMRTYITKNLARFAHASHPLLKQGNLFVCCRTEDISQLLLGTLSLVDPVVWRGNWNAYMIKRQSIRIDSTRESAFLTFVQGPLYCGDQTPVSRPPSPPVLDAEALRLVRLL